MTVVEWFNSRQGQSLLVPGAAEVNRGQCMQAWDYGLNEIYNLPYVWANAIDVWNKFDTFSQLKDNFDKFTDGSIKSGDCIVFGTNVGSVYGHIDWALEDGTYQSFQGADSNWEGNKTLHNVQHAGAQYILGVLRLKGGNMKPVSQQIPDALTVQLAYNIGLARQPSDSELASWQDKTVEQLMRTILNSAEHIALLKPSGFKTYVGSQLYVKDD